MIIVIDGNSTGKIIERYILQEDRKKLNRFSNSLKKYITEMGNEIINLGGSVIMCGGDNIIAEIGESYLAKICQIINENNFNDITFTVVFAETMQEAYVGLKYAKSIGQELLRVKRDSNGMLMFSNKNN